jgi:hypothetical protein
MTRRRRNVPRGRVPGVPVPSTEKSRAASRVAGWQTGRYARVVTAAEVFEQRLSMIEAGRIGTDEEREQVRRLQRELEASEEGDYMTRWEVAAEFTELVLGIGRAPRTGRESEG